MTAEITICNESEVHFQTDFYHRNNQNQLNLLRTTNSICLNT